MKSKDERLYFDYGVENIHVKLKGDLVNNWFTISRKEISGTSHMRCIWLEEARDEPSLLDSITSTSAKLVVIINNMESFQLDCWVYEDCSLPIIVLSASSGDDLRRTFDKNLEEQVQVMISLSRMQREETRMTCKYSMIKSVQNLLKN